MKCFYHNDLDGRCSAYWVYTDSVSGDFFEIDYNQDFPFSEIDEGELVWLVDYSFDDPKKMEQLLDITANVIWFDHHASTIRKYEDFPHEIEGKRVYGEPAACKLVRDYIWPLNPDDVMTEQIHKWDTWNHDDKTLDFRNGMLAQSQDPTHPIWEFAQHNPEKIIEEGKAVTKFRERRRKNYIKDYGFEAVLGSHNCMVCNMGNASSKLFDSITTSSYDVLVAYVYDGRNYKVSMYTTKDNVDVSKIAESYGGGGHEDAAGFTVSELPFKVQSDTPEQEGV